LGILRSIESRLERVVEGSVGRLFRASVAPVELARKLAKELEEGKVVSVTQTYAPNEYTVFLSPRDRARFAEFEASLRNELASYLAEHARRAGYVMPTRPKVRFETESSLHTGIFGISTALVRDDDAPIEPLAAPSAAAAGAAAGAAAASSPPSPPPAQPSPPPFPVAMPEEPVRSPLDPDPSDPVPPGFAVYPLEPDAEPGLEPAAESESGAEPDSESSLAPHVPGVPLHEDLPPPPVVPIPPLPLPDPPAMAPLPDAPVDPDVPTTPPVAEPQPEAPFVARGFDLPVDPPLEATMITRPEAGEELVIVHDGHRTPIEASVVQIGRAPGCDIVLDDRNVSRRHAEIRRRGPVVVLIDLDSTNGTIVNGRRVREHPLADGDRITLGNSRLTFERRTT
jgi:hypothetical protein